MLLARLLFENTKETFGSIHAVLQFHCDYVPATYEFV